jgi:hypothetical protein
LQRRGLPAAPEPDEKDPTMRHSPYQDRPSTSFWKSAVASSSDLVPEGLYCRKWPISPTERIATAGSCFAQHIGRHLKRNGFKVIDMEPPPVGLPQEEQQRFGYATYSARYGNIYTTRQLLQLAKEAFGESAPEDVVWQGGAGAFFDALRPGVEPQGLESRDEVLAHRRFHLEKVRQVFEAMNLMVFTMGLTETWMHRPSGTVYPTAPGTIAGGYDPELHVFKNFGFQEVVDDFLEFRRLVHSRQRSKCRFLLTVSPVPLTATASDRHVMVATVHSKSILRAAAGELASRYDDIDYFPSYEIVTNPWSKAMFYEENLRSVRPEAVAAVMDTFFRVHLGEAYVPSTEMQPPVKPDSPRRRDFSEDVICEEAILEAFGGHGR